MPARALDPGMGIAVGRRTVFRPEDQEDFGRVADRVATGNLALLGRDDPAVQSERARLRNAIASGALLTSGRHLQHGDADQPSRNMEVFTNCATAASSFAKFYLLLNGSGVGRSYDDALMAVDWSNAPDLLVFLSSDHPDHPAQSDRRDWFAGELGLGAADLPGFLAREMLASLADAPAGAILHRVADSREGWAKAIELLEALAFQGARDRCVVFDLSAVRPAGSPIRCMQGRPASGPISLLRALLAIRRDVITPARHRDPAAEEMQ
ncbi:MAG: recombinase, partial [Rhodospirillales bacterium]|nr:recombinase [Rhodospirillales bacterium]